MGNLITVRSPANRLKAELRTDYKQNKAEYE